MSIDKDEIAEELTHQKLVIRELRQRRNVLERQMAQQGYQAPPQTVTEIENLTAQISDHEAEVRRLQTLAVVDQLSLAEAKYRVLLTEVYSESPDQPAIAGVARLELERLSLGLTVERAKELEGKVRQALAQRSQLSTSNESHPKVNPPRLTRCPLCGNIAPHHCVHREDFTRVIDETDDGYPIYDECWWAVLKCQTCQGLSLHTDNWYEEKKRWGSKLLYPAPQQASAEVPQQIRRRLDEAVAVSKLSPSLSAVGIRRCLEAIMQDQGSTERTLINGIRDLAKRGVLPEPLVKMMETGRILGNLGAHNDEDVAPEDVQILVDFCLAVLEYLYVAPAKLKAVQERIDVRRAQRNKMPGADQATKS